VSAGLSTIALRAPAHPVARALLSEAGLPIAAPSANRSGRVSPTTAAAVSEELEGRADLILDGGQCPLGIESTVVGFADGEPVLLRPGAVAREEIEAVAGPLRDPQRDAIQAPGMMASHYAPKARVRLNAREVQQGEALLAFGPDAPRATGPALNLSPRGDLKEAAANLFAMLRQLDGSGVRPGTVMPIPNRGLGEAINDRLARAAAARED
jgi:L-threonylcarbamoyladenylate synthase